MKAVIFRVDGNKTIGMGHVMRCLALASAFFRGGYRVIFAMSDVLLLNKIKSYGFDFVCVDSKFDDYSFQSAIFLDLVKVIAPSVVVVDNYSVDSTFLLQIHNLTQVLYISEDYDPTIVNAVDYFVNYNIYMNDVTPIQSAGVQMLGTQFTLLREEFSKPLRDTTPERKTITVFTGGSDPLNIAPALVQQLVQDEHLFKYRVFVVSGELNPNIQELITMASRFNRVTIAINPSSISDIMDNTSIAVSSGGSILYELCSRGIPSISYSIAANQDRIVQKFDKLGLIPYAGNMKAQKAETIKKCANLVEKLSTSSSYYTEISRRMVDICNKCGASLVVRTINAAQSMNNNGLSRYDEHSMSRHEA